ncbi:unnamed protein product [Urochloa humidicola]
MLADYLRRSMESTKCLMKCLRDASSFSLLLACYYAALQKWEYLHIPILQASSSHWFKSWREESFRIPLIFPGKTSTSATKVYQLETTTSLVIAGFWFY